MKKKYEKPTLADLAMPVVNAQGFETMAVCSNGDTVIDTPDSCSTGSSDSTSGSQCLNGEFAGTVCGTGASPS